MKMHSKALLLAGLYCAASISTAARAQEVADHPRVNEVNQRIQS